MKKTVLLSLMLFSLFAISQISNNSLMGMPKVNNNDISSITGAKEGTVFYNSDKKTIFMYNGTAWVPVHAAEKITSLNVDATAGKLIYKDENTVNNDVNLKTLVKNHETLTSFRLWLSHKATPDNPSDDFLELVFKDENEKIHSFNLSEFLENYYNLSKTSTYVYGDIKFGVQKDDHLGWYFLNGRSVNSLPANAKANAEALGFTTNLPNATDRMIKTSNLNTDTIAQTGGSSTVILTRANLPKVNFTGSTSETGAHTHTIPRKVGNALRAIGIDPFYANGGTTKTSSNGKHKHTVSLPSGGENKPFNILPRFIVFNTFIYLGL
ncbi:MAG: hypothetical protein ACK5H1_07625 [Tenacibaculum sp.]